MYGNKEYLSYPFLYEKKKIVDFELATDEISSYLGFAASFCEHKELKEELIKLNELVYHLNPCVRNKTSLEGHELAWLYSRYQYYTDITNDRETLFVLPSGSKLASTLHILRCKSKQLVRLLHHIKEEGNYISEKLFDFSNVLANYFFSVALYANRLDQVDEIPFKSRIYK